MGTRLPLTPTSDRTGKIVTTLGPPDLELPAPQAVPANSANPPRHHVSVAEWLWLVLALLVGLALRIPFFRIPMVADEGGYAYATRGWIEGTGSLYGDLWISRPQGIFLVYAGIFDLFGSGTIALRFAAWIAAAVTAVAVWGYARLWITPASGIAAAFIFVVLSASPALEGYTANAEIFMGVPAALAALWLFHAGGTGWKGGELIGIGLLIGVTTSLKPSGAVMLLVAIAYIWMLGDHRDRRALVRRTLQVVGGAAVIGVISLLHGWYLGWSDFIYATFTYRLTAQSTATVGLEHNADAIGRLIVRCWSVISLVALTALLLNLHRLRGCLDARTMLVRMRHRVTRRSVGSALRSFSRAVRRRRRSDNGSLLLRLWIIGSILGMSVGGDWWPHYLIQIVPPLSIWLGASIVHVMPRIRRDGRRLVLPIFVGLLISPFWILILGSPDKMTEELFAHPGYPAQDAVASYLQRQTAPGTEIYVAFDQASIYYIADRPPAYRHLYDQELRGIPSSYSDLITIIRSPDRPEYIVGTRQPGPFADNSSAFWDEVGNYYKVEVRIEGVPIYRDKSLGD